MKLVRQMTVLISWLFTFNSSIGQCNNGLYAMSYSGVIYSVNTATGALTAISGTAPNSNTSNAIAYAGGVTPTFYFFSNSISGQLVFESYVQSSGTFNTLSLVNGPVDTVNEACIAPNYKGYYCMDIHGHLYYYDISLNSWTTVATVIKDQTGTDITATVATYSSGDMAFDGNGALWLLLANKATSKFGLYEVLPNVPTTNVGTITAHQAFPLGSSMPDGNDPVGMAFNASGQMYISTLNLSTYNCDLYLWNTISSTPILINSLSTVILDLASCSLPMGVLALTFEQFSASPTAGGTIALKWQVADQVNTKDYWVERSPDGIHWQNIGNLNTTGNATGIYSFMDDHPLSNTNYYRVKEENLNGQISYSQIITTQLKDNPAIRLWPNPVTQILYVENPFSKPVTVSLFNASGMEIMSKLLLPGTNQFLLNTLPPGMYVLYPNQSQLNKPLTFLKSW